MDSIAYTSRQLNSTSTSVHYFNLIVLCPLNKVDMAVATIGKCFDSVEVAYAYDEEASLGKYRL